MPLFGVIDSDYTTARLYSGAEIGSSSRFRLGGTGPDPRTSILPDPDLLAHVPPLVVVADQMKPDVVGDAHLNEPFKPEHCVRLHDLEPLVGGSTRLGQDYVGNQCQAPMVSWLRRPT